MAAAYVDEAHATSAGGTTAVVTKPNTVSNGHGLIAVVAGGFGGSSGGTITPPSGWNQVGSDHAITAFSSVALYRRIASSEPSSWTFTANFSLNFTVSVIVASGIDSSGLIHGTPVFNDTQIDNFSIEALSQSSLPAGALVVHSAGHISQNGAGVSWESGTTERNDFDISGNPHSTATEEQSSAGASQARTATFANFAGGDSWALTVALAPGSTVQNLTRTASDSITISDAATRGVVSRPRTGSDAITVSDAAVSARLASTLIDDFNDNEVNTTNWPSRFGTYSEAGGRAVVTPTSGYSALQSAVAYSLIGSSVHVEVPVLAAIGGGSTAQTILRAGPSTTNDLVMFTDSGQLYFRERVSGVNDQTSITYDATAHRWWRIREAGGTVYWDTSPNGVTWTNRRSKASAVPLSAVRVGLEAGYYGGTGGSAVAAEFDNFNITAVSFSRTGSDSITVSDAGSRASTSSARSSVDSASISDSAARSAVSRIRTATDTSATPIDNADRGAITNQRTAQEALAVTDSATRSVSGIRTGADSVSISDIATRDAITNSRIGGDSWVISDSASRTSAGTRTASDLWSISDASTGTQGVSRESTDTWVISDSADRSGYSRTREASDSTTFSDAAIRGVLSYSHTSTDSWSISDFAIGNRGTTLEAFDSFTITDEVTALILVTPNVVKAKLRIYEPSYNLKINDQQNFKLVVDDHPDKLRINEPSPLRLKVDEG